MKRIILCLIAALFAIVCVAQTPSDHEEFEYNRHLARTSHSFIPKGGFVPDKDAAIAIAYAVALPVYGKKQLDSELPLRAELKDGIWTVLGTLQCKSCDGGTLVLQIDKATGKILFLTHTQ